LIDCCPPKAGQALATEVSLNVGRGIAAVYCIHKGEGDIAYLSHLEHPILVTSGIAPSFSIVSTFNH
jgi:hypothetical protein